MTGFGPTTPSTGNSPTKNVGTSRALDMQNIQCTRRGKTAFGRVHDARDSPTKNVGASRTVITSNIHM